MKKPALRKTTSPRLLANQANQARPSGPTALNSNRIAKERYRENVLTRVHSKRKNTSRWPLMLLTSGPSSLVNQARKALKGPRFSGLLSLESN
jgi:hypothetical protein